MQRPRKMLGVAWVFLGLLAIAMPLLFMGSAVSHGLTPAEPESHPSLYLPYYQLGPWRFEGPWRWVASILQFAFGVSLMVWGRVVGFRRSAPR